MKRHRHSPEQALRKVREGERLLNEGQDLAKVLRHLEISEATWNRWRPKLLTPERRRRAVSVLRGHFGVSEPPSESEMKIRRLLRQIAKTHPRWGWKKAYEVLVREGWALNAKRTRRLWRHEGLRSPQSCTKRRRLHLHSAKRRQATRPNQVWAVDFQFDETADYRRLKLTNIVDEFTREALAMDVNLSSGADDLVAVIERLVAQRGAPEYLRMDNGPELVAWALRDWSRLAKLEWRRMLPGYSAQRLRQPRRIRTRSAGGPLSCAFFRGGLPGMPAKTARRASRGEPWRAWTPVGAQCLVNFGCKARSQPNVSALPTGVHLRVLNPKVTD